MVKVLNVISDSNIGGAGRVLLNYLKYYDRSVFDISVCLPEGSLLSTPLKDAGINVYEISISADKSFYLKDIKTISSLIQQLKPDIVHTHGSLSGRIAAKRCGKIVIYTRHSVFPVNERLKSGPGRFMNKVVNEHYADRIIAVSEAAKQNLTDGGISSDLIDVIMNGVEPVTRKSDQECRALRAQYGIEKNDFVCGILARIEPYKGHMLILEAARSLKEEGRKVKILIAGTGTYEDAVKKKANELGLADLVVFMGFITDVAPLLSILDVQLNASYGTEATSLSLLEGMSIGLPAIVSDYGGNPYVIENNKNGLVFRNQDSIDLADCIKKLMDKPAFTLELGVNALKIFDRCFTGQIFAKSIECIYMATLKGDKHGK